MEDVPAPEPRGDEVLVRVDAATTCGTDVKMWRRGHPILPPYPARFGHETAGTRTDTGERVLVGDSVACGACRPCRAGRPQICRDPRWVLGGFAELIAAPPAALHPVPAGLDAAGAAMAEPLAAAVHAVEPRARAGDRARRRRPRRRADGADDRRAARGRGADRDRRRPARGAARAGRGARGGGRGGARGPRRRVRGRRAAGGVARGGRRRRARRLRRVRRRLRGGERRAAADAPAALRRARPARRVPPRARRGRPRAGAARRRARWTGAPLAAGPIGLDALPGALAAGNDGPARKWVVLPR